MIWWAIGLSALFLWGGIVAVRPSPAQRRIANLRQAAIQRGLRVRLGSQLKLGLETDLSRVIAYILHRPKTLKNSSGTLLLDPATAEVKHAVGIFARPDAALEEIIKGLPVGCSLLVSNSSEVMIGWDERGSEDSVAQISNMLEELRQWSEKRPGKTIQEGR